MFENGLIQQWGKITMPNISVNNSVTSKVITLNKAFTTSTYNVQLTQGEGGQWDIQE